MARERDARYADRLPLFAHRLSAMRRDREMTQEQLAASAGLSVQMVRALEREAQPGNPRLTTLLALADALDVSLPYLLDPNSGAPQP